MNKKRTILIIDDHQSIRMILGNILIKEYNIVTKKDGIDAFAWLHEGNIPDLILLDMIMPRLHGISFLSNLRSSGFFSEIPVVVLSGNESKEFISKTKEMGINGYITKPFKPEILRTTIADAMNDYTPVSKNGTEY